MENSVEEIYEARKKRINDAIALRVPDRVPVAFAHCLYYMTTSEGISNKDAMNDHEKRLRVWKHVTVNLNLDLAVHPVVFPPAQPFSLLGVNQYKWPGEALPDDGTFQFVEQEYLKANEYDEFLADPGDFTIRKI